MILQEGALRHDADSCFGQSDSGGREATSPCRKIDIEVEGDGSETDHPLELPETGAVRHPRRLWDADGHLGGLEDQRCEAGCKGTDQLASATQVMDRRLTRQYRAS